MKKELRIINISVLLFIVLMGFIAFIGGSMMNNRALLERDGRMPVKDLGYDTKTHVSFSDDSELISPLLADRFHYKNYIFSIGDVFYYLGLTLVTVFIFIFLFNYIRFVRDLKKEVCSE